MSTPKYSISTPESDKYLRREMCLVTGTIDLTSVSPHLSMHLVCVCVCVCVCVYMCVCVYIYRVSQEECEILRESVP